MYIIFSKLENWSTGGSETKHKTIVLYSFSLRVKQITKNAAQRGGEKTPGSVSGRNI